MRVKNVRDSMVDRPLKTAIQIFLWGLERVVVVVADVSGRLSGVSVESRKVVVSPVLLIE
jgi:hypothetical protein